MPQFIGYVDWNSEEKIFLNSDLTYTKFINDSKYKIVMNGNLDNVEYISKEIINKEVKIQLGIDEEVLLLSYIIWHFDIVNKVNGDYISVIWNDRKKELIFLRDVNKKIPIFYSQYENGIFFASQKISLYKIPLLKDIFNMGEEKYIIYNRQGIYKMI